MFGFFNVNIRLTFSDTSHPLKILLYMFWDEISILLTFLSLSTCSLFGTETATMISYQLKFLYVECTLPLVRKERRQPRSKKKKSKALSSTLQKAALSLYPHFFFVPFLVPVTWQTELCVHA